MQCIIVENTMQIPDLFIPERWTKEFLFKLPRFAYFPFGGRNSIMYWRNIRSSRRDFLLLATIFQRWKILPTEGEGISFEPKSLAGFTKPKYPIKVIVKSRN